jgi:tetratricopeptide (TPR) repeat protein
MRLLIIGLVVGILAGSASAQRKGRKLPEKAYIESAQISIGYKDTTHLRIAMPMLDSLLIFYGAHPEAYYWMNQVAAGFVEAISSPKDKEPWVIAMAAYRDSLHRTCDNPDIKVNYRKNCKDYIERSDSTAVKFWRIFYNQGIEQMESIDEALKEITAETDSASKASYDETIKLSADSAMVNVALCIIIDSTDNRAYLLAGTVAEKQGDLAKSNEWLMRGLKYTTDSTQILLQVAYNVLGENKYCEAIPYLKQYLSHQPADTGTLLNLTICYNNCKMYDSAAMVHHQILAMNPNQTDALLGLGQYFNQLGIWANDSASAARTANNDALTKKWTEHRTSLFDSSKVYFKRAYESNPTNLVAAEEYAIVAFVTNDFAGAAAAFAKLTELEPTKSGHWISLGDASLNMKDFKAAIAAYEKAVELDPENRQVWESLVNLYNEEGQPAKAAKAKEHLK